MPAAYAFSAPSDTFDRLKALTGGNLLSFLRQLHWSYLERIIGSSADLDSTGLYRYVLEALPSSFDDVFYKVTEKTFKSGLIHIIRAG